MTLFQTLISEITFFEVAMSLLAVGLIERVVVRLPETMVGPEGWLLTTDK